MKKVLLLSRNGKSKNSLMTYFMEAGGYEITAASNAAAGKGMMVGSRFDLVIINTPLEDQFGDEAATFASVKSDAGVIILIKNALVDNYAVDMERHGVMVVGNSETGNTVCPGDEVQNKSASERKREADFKAGFRQNCQ